MKMRITRLLFPRIPFLYLEGRNAMTIQFPNIEIELYPVSGLYGDDDKSFSFSSLEAGALPEDTHTIDAVVDVKPGTGPEPVCTTIKEAFFRTNRSTQTLNLTMNVAPELEDKIHFLKATCQNGHAAKCRRVEHNDPPIGTPRWARDFGKDCPSGARKISLVFSIPRRTEKFNFDIYLLVNQPPHEPFDFPCDPQVGNDPP
jgi:hypothetical protein